MSDSSSKNIRLTDLDILEKDICTTTSGTVRRRHSFEACVVSHKFSEPRIVSHRYIQL